MKVQNIDVEIQKETNTNISENRKDNIKKGSVVFFSVASGITLTTLGILERIQNVSFRECYTQQNTIPAHVQTNCIQFGNVMKCETQNIEETKETYQVCSLTESGQKVVCFFIFGILLLLFSMFFSCIWYRNIKAREVKH